MAPVMSGLKALRRDHYDKETMLAVFEAAVDRLEQGRYVDAEMLTGIVRFFDQFVGKCHQVKEEAVLFPLLESSQAVVTVVPALRQQHESQRESVGVISRALEMGRLEGLGLETRTYVASVREHLSIERRFFAEVEADLLSPAQDEALARQFEIIERRSIGPTGREWYTQLVADYRDMVSTWGHWPDV
jgi:hemerythrin-like domain-containing protein